MSQWIDITASVSSAQTVNRDGEEHNLVESLISLRSFRAVKQAVLRMTIRCSVIFREVHNVQEIKA